MLKFTKTIMIAMLVIFIAAIASKIIDPEERTLFFSSDTELIAQDIIKDYNRMDYKLDLVNIDTVKIDKLIELDIRALPEIRKGAARRMLD